jgi:hypothetical protein
MIIGKLKNRAFDALFSKVIHNFFHRKSIKGTLNILGQNQSIFAFAVDFRAPSFPLFSAERVGYQ